MDVEDFGDGNHLDWDEKFSEKCTKLYIDRIIQPILKNFFKVKTHFVGTKTLSYSLKFMAFLGSDQMDKLKPFITNEMFSTFLHLFMVTHEETILFKEDPKEFENRQLDF